MKRVSLSIRTSPYWLQSIPVQLTLQMYSVSPRAPMAFCRPRRFPGHHIHAVLPPKIEKTSLGIRTIFSRPRRVHLPIQMDLVQMEQVSPDPRLPIRAVLPLHISTIRIIHRHRFKALPTQAGILPIWQAAAKEMTSPPSVLEGSCAKIPEGTAAAPSASTTPSNPRPPCPAP